MKGDYKSAVVQWNTKFQKDLVQATQGSVKQLTKDNKEKAHTVRDFIILKDIRPSKQVDIASLLLLV